MSWSPITATLVPGHGVASGAGHDPRYPGGTLALQWPHFEAGGLDLSPYHRGTLNLDIAPARYEVLEPKLTLRGVRWTDHIPPEDFSFFDGRLLHEDRPIEVLIYYPHPETKPEHFQSPSVLEILAPRIDGVLMGARLVLEIDSTQLRLLAPGGF